MKQKLNNQGFTLIELLVVLGIIGILAGIVTFAAQNGRVKGRDAKRAADIRQLITGMEQYHIQHGVYPTGTQSVTSFGTQGVIIDKPLALNGTVEALIPAYFPTIPASPQPNDGNCLPAGQLGGNNYWYEAADLGTTYTLTFCLGNGTSDWGAGVRVASPDRVK